MEYGLLWAGWGGQMGPLFIEDDPATTKPTEWMLKSEGHRHDRMGLGNEGSHNLFLSKHA